MTVARVRIGKIRLKPSTIKKMGHCYWLHFGKLIENGREVEAIFSRFAVRGLGPWESPPPRTFGRSA
jgi:hypothetical protein